MDQIGKVTRTVLNIFRDLKNLENSQWQSAIIDREARFQLWAANIGAYHTSEDPRSADTKLRHASSVRKRILQVLGEMRETLSDAHDILSGRRIGGVQEISEEDGVTDFDGPQSEVEELLLSAEDLVGSLMKISVLIRDSNERNRGGYAKAAKKRRLLPTEYDIRHVQHKYPKLWQHQQLTIRLGEAITERREFLLYAREHRDRIAFNPLLEGTGDEENIQGLPNPREVATTSRPSQAVTGNTTIFSARIDPMKLKQLDDFDIEDTASQASSYISTTTDTNEGSRLEVPQLGTYGEFGHPFECPLCCGIVMFKHQRSWKAHVLADLRAFACTDENCNVSIFDSKSSWIAHEQKMHRRMWRCPQCSKHFSGRAETLRHVQTVHEDCEIAEELTETMIDAASPAIQDVTPESCCFCDAWDERLRQERWQRQDIPEAEPMTIPVRRLFEHLARHLEQLALFAIGPNVGDDEEQDHASNAPQPPDQSSESESIEENTYSGDSRKPDPLETQKGDMAEPQETGANTSIEASCAICGVPSYPECPHEGHRLEIALNQAIQRSQLSDRLSEEDLRRAKDWILNHARAQVINSYHLLQEMRQECHRNYISTLPYYALYHHYGGSPPLQPAQIELLRSQIAQAGEVLQQGIDQDWRTCCLMYPDALDNFTAKVIVKQTESGECDVSFPSTDDYDVLPGYDGPGSLTVPEETLTTNPFYKWFIFEEHVEYGKGMSNAFAPP